MIGRPVVGRSLERPEEELFYWLEGCLDDLVELSRPGNRARKYVGRASDFRRYGDALAARVNPKLARLSLRRRHVARARLVGEADRTWDTYGLRE